jgi:phenylpropionate dioxygenase-like ring-hydroxylating dioxygenase large terminal subunit
MNITTDELNNHMKSLLNLIENKTTSLADGLLRIPTALYTDKSYWQEEIGEIFYRQPLTLGLNCQVPTPNSYHALEEVPGFRVVLTRDGDGVVHGFFNSCSHRGAPVASGSRQVGRFSCPYHGWTYSTKGELIGLSESDTFGAKPCADLNLVEFPVEERHGIIFGVLDPNANLDLDKWLGDYGPELEKIGLGGMTAMWSHAFEGPNWKVCKDGFIENYHFAAVHAESLPTLMSNTNLTDIFDIHARVLMPHKHIVEEGEKPEAEWNAGGTFESVFVMFPSTMIASAWGDWPLVTRIFPGPTPEQSTCVQTLLCRLPYTEELQKQADDLQALYKSVTQDEDYVLDFAIQESLENNPHEHFSLGRNELSVQHFHRSIAKFVAPLSPLEELSNV